MSFSQQILSLEVYAQTDVVKKCKKYPEFSRELQQIEQAYAYDLNMAIYSSLQQAQDMGVFKFSKGQNLYVLFYAYLMPPQEQFAQKFFLLWIKLMDQQLRLNVGKKYSIIYHHSLCESSYPYQFLVAIFKKLPIYYYAMLDKIMTVDTSFFVRKSAGLFEFGRLYKLFDRKIQNIEKISDFVKNPQVIKNNLIANFPQRLMSLYQEKTKKKMMKQQTKDKITPNITAHIPQNGSQAHTMHHYVEKKDCLNIEINQHKLDPSGIPVPLAILLDTLRQNQTFLQLQGIFRKSGSIQEEEQIIIELSKLSAGQKLKNIADYSGFAIAGVVKKFFTKLLTPIVPYAIYHKLIEVMSQNSIKPEDQITFILDFLNQIPVLNKKVILHLITFLKKQIIFRLQKNKMNNYNMSVCFCPCLFRSEAPTLADLLNSGKFAGILNILFLNYDEIMGIQERGSKDKQKMQGKYNNKIKDYRISMA